MLLSLGRIPCHLVIARGSEPIHWDSPSAALATSAAEAAATSRVPHHPLGEGPWAMSLFQLTGPPFGLVASTQSRLRKGEHTCSLTLMQVPALHTVENKKEKQQQQQNRYCETKILLLKSERENESRKGATDYCSLTVWPHELCL